MFITQPTLTPTNTIINAITNLANALKGTRNIKGIQVERLKLLGKLLNNIPQKLTEPLETPAPRVEDIQPAQQEQEELTHPILMTEETSIILAPTPRVQEEELTHPTLTPEETSIILMPTPRVQDKEKETQETNRILL
jgi:hypothetical protein